MEYQDILFERRQEYVIVTLNRPDSLNAMREITKAEIQDALDRIEEDKSIRGLIITGSGRAFSAGSDIHEIHVDEPAGATVKMSRHAQAMMNRIEALELPVIAACNGFALGGGTELALACDIRIAAENAVFGLPEVKMAVAPCYGGTQRLPRLIGAAKAKELLFSGRKVSAQEALQIGLVNQVVPGERVLEAAEEMMRSFTANGPQAIAACKRLVHCSQQTSLEQGLCLEAYLNGLLAETPDAKEGVQAFFEKRRPVFGKG